MALKQRTWEALKQSASSKRHISSDAANADSLTERSKDTGARAATADSLTQRSKDTGASSLGPQPLPSAEEEEAAEEAR